MKNKIVVLGTLGIISQAFWSGNVLSDKPKKYKEELSEHHHEKALKDEHAFAKMLQTDVVKERLTIEVAKIIVKHPKILLEALERMKKQELEKMIKEQEKNKKEMDAAFKASSDKVKALDGIVLGEGSSDSKTLHTFVSPYCPHCRALLKDYFKLLEKDPSLKIKIFFIASPDGPDNHASRAMIASHKHGKFQDFLKHVSEKFNILDEAELLSIAEKVGIKKEDFKKAMESADVKKHIEEARKLAEAVKIMGTPITMYRDKVIQGYSGSLENLQKELKKLEKE